MLYRDRIEAAKLLARKLERYRHRRPLVLGIPRGAVPMAAVIASYLGGDLDVVLVRKLGAPEQPEFAVGAVSEDGAVWIDPRLEELGVSIDVVKESAARELDVIRSRRRLFSGGLPPVDAGGRNVIVVDDGTATGFTMIAAVRYLRRQAPRRIIAALAVASPPAFSKIVAEVDDVECLDVRADFAAVGQWFEDFSEVTDEEVTSILARPRV